MAKGEEVGMRWQSHPGDLPSMSPDLFRCGNAYDRVGTDIVGSYQSVLDEGSQRMYTIFTNLRV